MKRATLNVTCILVFALLLPAVGRTQPADTSRSTCDPNGKQLASIIPRKQETSAWCWVASAQMVMETLGIKEEQYFIVDAVRQNILLDRSVRSCCCESRNTASCTRGGWPEWALSAFGFIYGKISDDRKFGWNELATEICQDRPIIYVETWQSGGGHSYVLRSYRVDPDSSRWVEVYDHDPELAFSHGQGDFEEWSYETLPLIREGPDPFDRNAVYYYKNIKRSQ
jgi:hypothetical protein